MCRTYCFSHIFLQVWDLFYEADKVRAMLTRKIQEEALRTYLFTYSKVYDSISVVSKFKFEFGNIIIFANTWEI